MKLWVQIQPIRPDMPWLPWCVYLPSLSLSKSPPPKQSEFHPIWHQSGEKYHEIATIFDVRRISSDRISGALLSLCNWGVGLHRISSDGHLFFFQQFRVWNCTVSVAMVVEKAGIKKRKESERGGAVLWCTHMSSCVIATPMKQNQSCLAFFGRGHILEPSRKGWSCEIFFWSPPWCS